jgi:hypothetical protein
MILRNTLKEANNFNPPKREGKEPGGFFPLSDFVSHGRVNIKRKDIE